MTETSTKSAPPAVAKAGSTGSAVRLIVLLGVLALVVGAWFYDYSVAAPGSKAKYEAIEKMATEKNAMGVKEGGTVSSDDVKQVVGFPPTYVEKSENHTIEWYCWWGKIPGLNTWKRYITVVYIGEPRRFSSHYMNEAPPLEAVGGTELIETPTTADTAGQPITPPTRMGSPAGSGGGRKGPGSGNEGATGAESASDSAKGADTKPAEDKPAEDKSAEDKPAEDKPAEVKPAEVKPAEDKPAEDKPAEKPAATETAETKP